MPELKEKLHKEINSGAVLLKGWMQSSAVIKAIRESDIFLLTSTYEGFCISLIEAMANGCCPLVTDIKSGNKELIKDQYNGFIFPIGDVQAFVNKIIELKNTPSTLMACRNKAWLKGKEYSTERMANKYLECFEQGIQSIKADPRSINKNFPLMDSCRSTWPTWIRRIKAAVLN